jgi:hypothetical protein
VALMAYVLALLIEVANGVAARIEDDENSNPAVSGGGNAATGRRATASACASPHSRAAALEAAGSADPANAQWECGLERAL